jgi:hypothetical protein
LAVAKVSFAEENVPSVPGFSMARSYPDVPLFHRSGNTDGAPDERGSMTGIISPLRPGRLFSLDIAFYRTRLLHRRRHDA